MLAWIHQTICIECQHMCGIIFQNWLIFPAFSFFKHFRTRWVVKINWVDFGTDFKKKHVDSFKQIVFSQSSSSRAECPSAFPGRSGRGLNFFGITTQRTRPEWPQCIARYLKRYCATYCARFWQTRHC